MKLCKRLMEKVVVQRTPYKDAADHGKVKYDEKIVQQLPQVPKRKDKI